MDQLEASGYVERLDDPRDRRQTLLELTNAGREAYGAALDAAVSFNRKALRDVDPAELKTLERLMRKVVRNVIDDREWADSILRFEAVSAS